MADKIKPNAFPWSALGESERLLAALEQAPIGIGLFDSEGRFVVRAGRLGRLWGPTMPSRDQGQIKRWRSYLADGRLLHPDDYPSARALRGETVLPGIDFIHTADDGHEAWIRVAAKPFRNSNGQLVGGVAILQNVDNEKRIEHSLRRSEARLQAAVDLVKLGLYSWNPKTNELDGDATVKETWGLPPDATIDYALWRSCVHPDDLARVEAQIQKCTDPNGDGTCQVEYRITGRDGVERWIATHGRMSFSNGEPRDFLGALCDVSDRKRAERAVRESEARFRQFSEHSPNPLWIMDIETQAVSYLPAAAKRLPDLRCVLRSADTRRF